MGGQVRASGEYVSMKKSPLRQAGQKISSQAGWSKNLLSGRLVKLPPSNLFHSCQTFQAAVLAWRLENAKEKVDRICFQENDE